MATIDLRGKVALVTGSARRVGKAIALELARQGMQQVIHHSNSDEQAEATAKEIGALGVDTLIVKADQRQPADVQRMFTAIRERFGRIDVLVNSASTFETGSFLDLPFENWKQTLSVNLDGPFLCSQQAARLMRDTNTSGAIVNILDLSALKPWKTHPAHSVSKAGLASLTEIMAVSLGPDIRVNAIALGSVLRDEGHTPEQWEANGKRLPLGHMGDPSDAAQAVVYLVAQPFITGAILRVDGGDLLR
jgi:NAD(P)-dependent dehydrogenase (short-subunit alcohol dehydrogenase family)